MAQTIEALGPLLIGSARNGAGTFDIAFNDDLGWITDTTSSPTGPQHHWEHSPYVVLINRPRGWCLNHNLHDMSILLDCGAVVLKLKRYNRAGDRYAQYHAAAPDISSARSRSPKPARPYIVRFNILIRAAAWVAPRSLTA
jgi:hypothetical protein